MWRPTDDEYCWHEVWEEDGEYWFLAGPSDKWEEERCDKRTLPYIDWMRTRIVTEVEGVIRPDAESRRWLGNKSYERGAVTYHSMEEARVAWREILANPIPFIMRQVL